MYKDKKIAGSIHPIWLIDEKVKILRKEIWFNPITPLTSILMITIVIIKLFKEKLYINKIIGAIFCQVNMSKLFVHLSPSITSGNQKWNGAAPIFVKSAEFIIKK